MTDQKMPSADPLDEAPFSNSDEGYAWQANWCERCIHDLPAREGRDEDACGIWTLALAGMTPGEWLRQPGDRWADRYHCIEFRDEGDGPPPPTSPQPTPPGQGELIPMEPYTGVRMFADVVATAGPAPVGGGAR